MKYASRILPILLLTLCFAGYLLHQTQHQIDPGTVDESTNCEFCLTGHGPTALTSSSDPLVTGEFQACDIPAVSHQISLSFRGFQFSSRAPPTIGA
ncbi:MAG: hypothetical protein OEZ43_10820 [Gammaproteobacteria bacterium]|nr:hypothetical protein [Gammaproteobacteria bacterium]